MIKILTAVAEVMELTPENIINGRRFPRTVLARQLAIYLLRKEGLSFSEIGLVLRKNHATIIHNLQRFETRLQKPEIMSLIERVKRRLENKENES